MLKLERNKILEYGIQTIERLHVKSKRSFSCDYHLGPVSFFFLSLFSQHSLEVIPLKHIFANDFSLHLFLIQKTFEIYIYIHQPIYLAGHICLNL